MNQREYGRTGLKVTELGFGAMHINDLRTSEEEAGRLLNQVLDAGVNLIDTARGYGLSEERIGRWISHRRSEYVLSTKVGYGIEGHQDWTYSCIVAGVDEALRKMKTDHLDIVHLHSCPLTTLQAGEVTRALGETVKAGKVRVAAYSGDNAELDWAIESGVFGGVQTSLSVCDQQSIADRLRKLGEKGLGVIAKRPLAGAVWRFDHKPDNHAEGHYWQRLQEMGIDPRGLAWDDLALRFVAHLPGLASAIVGTSKIEHLRANIAITEKGPLPAALHQAVRQAFLDHDNGWVGMI